ncbi:hypothetical protein B0A53_03294 [Rhodotorula sp. CCFEE 5036]|nr:hypothetical protein B0A53_03294 [Rhodotorula sp. CCFEE 5036]
MSLTVQRLLYPLHLAVLVSLHAVLATSRATRLAFRLGHLVFRPWFPRRRRSAPASSLSDDLADQRWSKLPRHLAVSLVSGGQGGEQRQRHVGILQNLLQWSRQLGVTTLSVYDETGVLLRNAAGYAEALNFQIISKEDDIELEGMVTLAEPWVAAKSGVATSPAGEGARTPRTAEEDASADSSTTLADRASPDSHKISQSASGTREKTLPLGEPDLLLVFGGSYLRLHGFPPWQLRLTEMYHHSWPTWFSRPPELTYDILRKALDVYGRAEMRLGR